VAQFTRKELKSDKFALEVQHSVEYVSEHRQQLIRWGGIGLAVVILVVAVLVYRNHEHSVRQEALHQALQIQNAQIGNPIPNSDIQLFPTEAARLKAATQAFTDIATKYSGTEEGTIADYFLGTNASDTGNYAEAEKRFKEVVDSGDNAYRSVAEMALGQVYASEGKTSDAEKALQWVVDHPTVLVSKEEATLALGQILKTSDPQRARKLIEPLRSSPRPAINRQAIAEIAELSQQK